MGQAFTKKHLADEVPDVAGANGIEGLVAHFASDVLELERSGLSVIEGSGVALIAFGAPRSRDDDAGTDAEMLPGWWGDPPA